MSNIIIKAEHVQALYAQSQKKLETVFEKCTVLTVKLPNGFTLTESAGCVDPENYSAEIGYEICKKKIIDKIWLLEGYVLQTKVHEGLADE